MADETRAFYKPIRTPAPDWLRTMRGIVIGLMISIPLWLIGLSVLVWSLSQGFPPTAI